MPPKLSEHTAYRPRQLIVIQAASIGFCIRMWKNTALNWASLLVMWLCLELRVRLFQFIGQFYTKFTNNLNYIVSHFVQGRILQRFKVLNAHPAISQEPGLQTRSNFIRVQPILASPSSSSSSLILLFTSSSSTKISFFEFKFEFRQTNIQNRDNFFTASAHAMKTIKIFRSCSRFKTYLSSLVPYRRNCWCCGHNWTTNYISWWSFISF